MEKQSWKFKKLSWRIKANVCYLTVLILLTLSSCSSAQDNSNLIGAKYYGEDKSNSLGIFFRTQKDTIFLYYMNVIDAGAFINGYENDSTDYAGYFLKNEIQINSVTLDIKDYRDPELYYSLTMKFDNDFNIIDWEINNKEDAAYIPKKIVLHKEKNGK